MGSKQKENKIIKHLDKAFDFNLSSLGSLIYIILFMMLFWFSFLGLTEKLINGYFEYVVFIAIMLFGFYKVDVLLSREDGLMMIPKSIAFLYFILLLFLGTPKQSVLLLAFQTAIVLFILKYAYLLYFREYIMTQIRKNKQSIMIKREKKSQI